MFKQCTNDNNTNFIQECDHLDQYITTKMDTCFQLKCTPKSKSNIHHTLETKSLKKFFLAVLKPLLSCGRNERCVAQEYILLLKELQLEMAQKSRASRLNATLLSLQNENEHFSVQKFWKCKKAISSKGDNKTSIITEQDIELFEDDAIVNEYVNEFSRRLSHRTIAPELQSYQDISHQLLKECLLSAKKNEVRTDFSVSEVKSAIHQLHNGKSPDPNMFTAEIFKNAGYGLISAITRVLNNIKNQLVIPRSWINVIVVTLYKNKGSKKRLKNHRGIFLCAILSKVMEKLIKNRTKVQFQNINSLQFGATDNCSTADCTFIIRSLIDHALYLNKPIFLTLYDYSTCFDSLWLEDTMLSLWDIGIRDELFPLIYEMNKQSLISVRTPFGTSKQFSCPSIVKQGAVLSTNLCGSSTGQLIQVSGLLNAHKISKWSISSINQVACHIFGLNQRKFFNLVFPGDI